MYNACYGYGIEDDILFNPIKTVCTILKSNSYKFYLPTVCIGSHALKYVSDTKYLEFSSCDSKSDDNSTKFAPNKVFVG